MTNSGWSLRGCDLLEIGYLPGWFNPTPTLAERVLLLILPESVPEVLGGSDT
jgi:hypothetical protein